MKSLRTLRKQQKMTLAQVGQKTGLSISFLSDLEHGRTAPSLHTLESLASCYQVSMGQLMGEEPATNPATEQGLYMEIGARIYGEREALGFLQADLATEIGLTRTSITNIESGRQRMLIHTLYALADALGISIHCLLPDNLRGEQDEQRNEMVADRADIV